MAYSAEKWAEAKSLYESGNHTIDTLNKETGISIQAIKKRIITHGWEKGKNSQIIDKIVEESTIEMFARLGLPKERVLKKIAEGMEATKLLISGNKEEAFAEVVPDHQAIEKYITQYNKMCGQYAPEKQEIKQETDIKMTNEDLQSLSTEELNAMASIMQKLGK